MERMERMERQRDGDVERLTDGKRKRLLETKTNRHRKKDK